jgi:hypothetical protein
VQVAFLAMFQGLPPFFHDANAIEGVVCHEVTTHAFRCR